MIVTDRMLFLHLHKSGGTFVNALLMQCIPAAARIGYHLPYREVPAAWRALPVVGTVRNPWAYYVSWYHFQRTRQKPNILYRICSNDGQFGFERSVANLVNLADDERRLALLEEGLPENYAIAGLNLTKGCVRELRDRRLGFYSFLYERLYAGANAPRILPVERLRDALRELLAAVGHLPNACAERFLESSPPLNVSEHEPAGHYYGADLAALVADRDSGLIERYGYTLSA